MGVAAQHHLSAHIDAVMGQFQLIHVEQGIAGAAAVEVDDDMIGYLSGIVDVVHHVLLASWVGDGVDGGGGAAGLSTIIAVSGGNSDIGGTGFHDGGVALPRAGEIVVEEGELQSLSLHDGRLSRRLVVDAGTAGGDSVGMEILDGIQNAVGTLIETVISADCGNVNAGVFEGA